MPRLAIGIILIGWLTPLGMARASHQNLDGQLMALAGAFAKDYRALGIPEFTPDYQVNFKAIRGRSDLLRQRK